MDPLETEVDPLEDYRQLDHLQEDLLSKVLSDLSWHNTKWRHNRQGNKGEAPAIHRPETMTKMAQDVHLLETMIKMEDLMMVTMEIGLD